ncbi:immunity repressor [Gordonia phage Nyceirae]|uniref:Immunity repressor n=1 Tax=Gordonia phage Nyceirae TaxID=1887651 RepID=A0A1C9EHX8_9CAUD|nr:transcriptional repressor [Gordonia phage Nyceirae]AON97399.1 immunity repressor [Gordonia phage Nyceirae]
MLNAGQRLAVAREYVGLSQVKLAERLDVTPATVQRAESGKTQPRRTTFMAWAMATGVDLHWLETGEVSGDDPGPDGGATSPDSPNADKCCSCDSAGDGTVVQLVTAA